MIIWQRWGILVLFCAGLGALSGFTLNAVINPVSLAGGRGGPIFAGIGLVIGAIYTALLVHLVILPKLDKPRPVLQQIPLPEPIQTPQGLQTHRVVPAVDPQTGVPLMRRPRSSLFFVPVQYWPFVLGVIGFVVIGYSGLSTLLG